MVFACCIYADHDYTILLRDRAPFALTMLHHKMRDRASHARFLRTTYNADMQTDKCLPNIFDEVASTTDAYVCISVCNIWMLYCALVPCRMFLLFIHMHNYEMLSACDIVSID